MRNSYSVSASLQAMLLLFGIVGGLSFSTVASAASSDVVALAASSRRVPTTANQPRAVLRSAKKLCIDRSKNSSTRSLRSTVVKYKICDAKQNLRDIKMEQAQARIKLQKRLMNTPRVTARTVKDNYERQMQKRSTEN